MSNTNESATNSRTPVTLRLPHLIADEVRQIAARDDLTRGAVLRRLVRRGLELERRDAQHGEAA